MAQEVILLTGAGGQIGTELASALREAYGDNQVIVSDIRRPKSGDWGLFEELNVLDADRLGGLIRKYRVTQIYHLAAVLSATGEQDPLFAWQINMDGTLNVFAAALEHKIAKVYFPSSIAVFGKDTPRYQTPQHTVMNPSTVYGISKLTGELWAEYYFRRWGLDVRSLRYPGIISYKTPPGGGTTDYAVDIYYHAAQGKRYDCFLREDTYLPMMYMPDAIRATLELMNAPAAQVKVRTAYNLTAMSFCPAEVARAIKAHVPDFKVSYRPDFRQAIADSWPASIDDAAAQQDWGWQPAYNLERMTADMLLHLQEMLVKS